MVPVEKEFFHLFCNKIKNIVNENEDKQKFFAFFSSSYCKAEVLCSYYFVFVSNVNERMNFEFDFHENRKSYSFVA